MIQPKTIVVNKGFDGWQAKADFTGGWMPTAWTNQAPFDTVKQELESINPGYAVEQYRVEHSDCRF
jgi:hypothetical protein